MCCCYQLSFIVNVLLLERSRNRNRNSCREVWSRIERWLSRSCAARSTLGELEAALERQLKQREKARADRENDPDATQLLQYLKEAIADTQQQIMQIEVRMTLFRQSESSEMHV